MEEGGVDSPHCARFSLCQWWQIRIASRMRSGPVAWDGKGGLGRFIAFALPYAVRSPDAREACHSADARSYRAIHVLASNKYWSFSWM